MPGIAIRAAIAVAAAVLLAGAVGSCAGVGPVSPSGQGTGWLAGEAVSGSGPAASPRPTDRMAIEGRVTGADSQPVAGARVYLHPVVLSRQASDSASGLDVWTTSDSSGHFEFRSPPEGVLNLEIVQSANLKAFKSKILSSRGVRIDLGTVPVEGTGTIVGKVAAKGPGGGPAFDGGAIDVYIPGSSFVAKTDGAGNFRLEGVAAASYELVAARPDLGIAVLEGIAVRPGAVVRVDDLELRPRSPSLSRMFPLAAGPGAEVELQGANLGTSSGAEVTVTVGGAPARVIAGPDDTKLTFVVPGDGRSGDVVVSVRGDRSNALPLAVLQSLSFQPAEFFLLAGGRERLSLAATDTRGQAIGLPDLQVEASGSSAAIEGQTTLVGKAPGTTILVASSGRLTATASAVVVAGTVQSIRLEPAVARLGRLWAPQVRTTCFNVMSDGSTNSLATLELSAPGKVVLGPNGALTAGDPESNDTLELRATSMLDDTKIATAAVKLWNVARVVTVAGGEAGYLDGVGAEARFSGPNGLAVDPSGDLLIADGGNNAIRKMSRNGWVTTLAGIPAGAGPGAGFADGSALEARFNWPVAVATDAEGNVLVADYWNSRVRRIGKGGNVTTLAGPDPDGPLSAPTGVAVDHDGTIYAMGRLYGKYPTYRSTLVRIDPGGTPTPVAGDYQGNLDGPGNLAQFSFNYNIGLLAASPLGDLLLAEEYQVRRITREGMVTTVARIPAYAVAVDHSGAIYARASAIVKIFPDGRQEAVAGSATAAFADGDGTDAFFDSHGGLAVLDEETIYVADNNRIRKIGR